MSNVIQYNSHQEVLASIKGLTIEQTLARLEQITFATGELIREAACLVHHAEELGVDMRRFKQTLLPALRLVWEGKLLVEAFLHFFPKPGLLPIVAKLPREEQERLADGGRLPVVVIGTNPAIELYTTRMVDPMDPKEMSKSVEEQLIDRREGRIRDKKEQMGLLDQKRKEEAIKTEKVTRGNMVIDPDRGGAMCRGWVSWEDMEAALAYKRRR